MNTDEHKKSRILKRLIIKALSKNKQPNLSKEPEKGDKKRSKKPTKPNMQEG